MAFAVFLDLVLEVAKHPVFGLGDLAAIVRDDLLKCFGLRFDLRRGNILARNKDMLVKRH